MSSLQGRTFIRTLHLVLSIPIIGFIYGPVAHIPTAAMFTRFVAVPLVVISGIWMWQKPRILRWLRGRKATWGCTAARSMAENEYLLRPIGVIESQLKSLADCPKQGSEGAPDAWLIIYPAFAEGLDELVVGTQVWIITWLHQGQHDVLKVRPRGDPNRPLQGVFSTRSPSRPNPIGLHRAAIKENEQTARIRVGPLEVLNGTPILDIKPVLREEDTVISNQ
jgi:tRNA-Thr(GGU) m(6)t(6)A37 methyltransferase TsaA